MQEFYRINSNLPIKNQIKLLNDMVLALHGMVEQGKFDENEITALYDQLGSGYSRAYARNVLLGNAFDTYSGWSHIHAESGYSIWKYTPDNYDYAAANQLYFNERALTNLGEAQNEAISAFDAVFVYDGESGGGYTNITFDVSTDDDNYASLTENTSGYIYLGSDSAFNGFKMEFQTRGSNYDLTFEYYNGASWVSLDSSGLTFTDNTSNFISDGLVSFTAPEDWATVEINGETKYWVRISTGEEPIDIAEARVIVPADSVIAVLALSSTQILNQQWAWCSYDDSVYVTIQNSGATEYEGTDYITSASSSVNLQNFFIYNNEFKADYLLT